MTVGSAHFVLREWYDPRRVIEALQRHREVPEDARGALGDEPRELTGEHWFAAPAHVREERAGYLGVRDGDRWWVRDPDGAVESNSADPRMRTTNASMILALLDPAAILQQLVLEERAAGTRAGRPTVELTAEPVADADRVELSLIGGNAQSWELALDAEHGVLLAAAALLDGRPYQIFEPVTAEFGVALDPALFAPLEQA